MSKDANSFLFDSSTIDHPKVLELRAIGGMAYFGLYTGILCKLRDADNYKLPIKFLNGLALSFGVTKQELETFLNACFEVGLLLKNDEFFWSGGLDEKLQNYDEIRNKKSEAGKRGAEVRWINKEQVVEPVIMANNGTKMATSCDANAMPIAKDGLYNLIQSNITKSNLIKSNNNKRGKLVIGTLPQVWDFPEARSALESWIQYRIEIKKPITQSTLTGLIKKYDPLLFIESVEFTIEKGWIGLREPDKNTTNPPKSGFVPFVKQTNFDRNMDILSESLERLHGSRDNLKKIN